MSDIDTQLSEEQREACSASLARCIEEGEGWLGAKERIEHLRSRLHTAQQAFWTSPSLDNGHDLEHVAHLMVQALDQLQAVEAKQMGGGK